MEDKRCLISSQRRPHVEEIKLYPQEKISDYQQAVILAKAEAEQRMGEFMLMSWYDRDRDFESPPNTTECAKGCEKNGYINYGLNHGATLKVDIEDGRFVFFFTQVEW